MYFAVMRSGSITRRLDYDYDYITKENIRDYVVYVEEFNNFDLRTLKILFHLTVSDHFVFILTTIILNNLIIFVFSFIIN